MTEPVHATSPDLAEPRTPLWLPALGAALFLTAGLVWAATPAPRPVVAEEASDAGADAPVDAAPPPASAAPIPSARPAPPPMPSPSAAAIASAAASAALQRINHAPFKGGPAAPGPAKPGGPKKKP